MSKYDRVFAFFWIVLSSAVLIQSLRMGIGTLTSPGIGFISFGTSGIMLILSLILLAQTILKEKHTEAKHPFAGLYVRRVIYVVISLILYSVSLRVLGYLVATFLLLLVFLVIVERPKWWVLIVFPACCSIVSYYIFVKLFNCQFPSGLLGF